MIKRSNNQTGQALLVLVLLLALVITVSLSISYKLTTETQITKSQEEKVRALAAADSGIDKGIQTSNLASAPAYQTYQQAGLTLQGIDQQRSSISISTAGGNQFVSPEISKDEQYLFYLGNYPDFNSLFTSNLNLYFGSDGVGSCTGSRTTPALELTIIYGAGNQSIVKYLLEPCSSGNIIAGGSGNGKIQPSKQSKTIAGTNFSYHIETNSIPIATYQNAKILIARVLFAKSRIGFASANGSNLPDQGKLIRSEAISNSGVSSVVTLFQSFPQIPADYFVTTF